VKCTKDSSDYLTSAWNGVPTCDFLPLSQSNLNAFEILRITMSLSSRNYFDKHLQILNYVSIFNLVINHIRFISMLLLAALFQSAS
jgi:hypothetical protein